MSITSSTSSSPRSEGGEPYEKKTPLSNGEVTQHEKMKEIVTKSLSSLSINAESSSSLKTEEITSKFQPDHPTTKMCAFIAKYGDDLAKKKISNFRKHSPEENAIILESISVLKISKVFFDLPPEGLPEEIGMLTGLDTLNLVSLGLSSLPNSITNLKKLAYLCLQGNKFTELPKHFVQARLNGELPDLTHINLNGNRNIKRLPLELSDFIVFIDARFDIWYEWKDIR